jgi:hypothetical protein
MPNEQGTLSNEELKKATGWLRSKLKVKTCPKCGDKEFALSESLAAIPMHVSGGMFRLASRLS